MKVDTLEVSLDVQAPVQPTVVRIAQPVQDGFSSLKAVGRKVVLAYIGACAVAYDSLAGLVQEGVKLFSTAEARGERMHEEVVNRLHSVEQKASGEMKKVQSQLEESVEQTKSGVIEARHGVTDELEKRVEFVLANLGVPSRERLDRLSREIDELNQKLDTELMRTHA